MAKQAAMVQVIQAVCCPSVLAAPLDAEEAADWPNGSARWPTRHGCGSCPFWPRRPRAKCACAISSGP